MMFLPIGGVIVPFPTLKQLAASPYSCDPAELTFKEKAIFSVIAVMVVLFIAGSWTAMANAEKVNEERAKGWAIWAEAMKTRKCKVVNFITINRVPREVWMCPDEGAVLGREVGRS